MNNENQPIDRRRLAIGIIVVFVLVCVFAVIFYFATRNSRMVVITNIDSCAEKLPSSQKETVFAQIYPFIEAQNKINEVGNKNTYTGVIREGTCTTKEYEDNGLKSSNARFILDIEDAEQSYRVSFNWIKTGDVQSPEIDLGSANLNCLLEEDLIYGDFRCNSNPLIQAANSGTDPILSIIPYFGNGYSLSPTLSSTSASGYSIILTFDPPEEVQLNGTIENFKESRRKMMESYLRDHDVDIDNYSIIERHKIVGF